MNRKIIVGIGSLAAVSIIIIALVVIPTMLPYTHSYSRTLLIPASNYGHVGATLDNGERVTYDFSSNVTVNAYLLTQAQFQYYYYYHSVPSYLDAISGTSGFFDYTHQSYTTDNIILLFETSSNPANVSVISVEYTVGI